MSPLPWLTRICPPARRGCEARLRALGAEVKPPRARVEGEGLSLYFYDFDNHLFELHTGTLAQRLARYAQG